MAVDGATVLYQFVKHWLMGIEVTKLCGRYEKLGAHLECEGIFIHFTTCSKGERVHETL